MEDSRETPAAPPPEPHERIEAETSEDRFRLDSIPTAPGCYLMRDAQGRVIYVGKAKNLRARVRAYVNDSDTRRTVQFLMQRAAKVDYLVTGTEKEALLLENSLIKEHRPRYNIRLKDDKTYVSLCVNVGHDFPRITVTRKKRAATDRHFGPYASAAAVRETLRHLQRLFPLRLCSDTVLRNRTRPCLYYQMQQCVAPCVGYVTKEEYREIVEQALLVLGGRSRELEQRLETMIRAHAERLEFEKAAELRDRLFALRRTLERQRTAAVAGADERDVFGVYTEGRFSIIQVLFFRDAKMVGGRAFTFSRRETPLAEVLSSAVAQFYTESATPPREVLLPLPLEDEDAMAELLTEQRGTKVAVLCPQRGEKRALVELASRNAASVFESRRLQEKANRDLLEEIRKTLALPAVPNRIECFDISTTQGDTAVGSMVTFQDGLADKSRYRRFSIRDVAGQDDFAMMREVLLRRYTRAAAENDLPELVLVDGGKGQLNVALTVLRDLGIEDIGIASIAKARPDEPGARGLERFFIPGRANPIVLPQNSPLVLFLARVRDEAHRFAVTYHRKRRSRSTLSSRLLEIPGIGPKRARLLLNTFGSLSKIGEAPLEVIRDLPGFNADLAGAVKSALTKR